MYSLTNRYTAIDAAPHAGDPAGNLTRDRQNYRYEYDAACPGKLWAGENRIARIYKLSGETQITVASFDYDAFGHRVRKIDSIAGQTTQYYHDPAWRLLAEYATANNQQLRKYVYGNYIDEALVLDDPNGNDGSFWIRRLRGNGNNGIVRANYSESDSPVSS